MSTKTWNVPDFALRRLRESRRKRRDAQVKHQRDSLKLKKAAAHLMPLERSLTGWGAASDTILECPLILNDLSERGTYVFIGRPMAIGSRVGFSLAGFGSFHARARVTGCTPVPTTGRIMSEHGAYRYRMKLEFEFESELEVITVAEFTRDIRNTFLSANS